MEIPTTNFFQVTINTNKLYSFIFDIKKQIQIQQSKTDELFKSIGSMMTFGSQFQKFQTDMALELEKIRRSAQEQNNYLRLYMKDADKKAGEKLQQLEKANAVLSSRINNVKEELQEDQCIKLSYLEKKIQNKTGVEDVESKINEEIVKLRETMGKIQQKQQKISSNLENDLKKNVQFSSNLIQRLNQAEFQRKNESQRYIQEDRENNSRSHKRLKTQKINTFNSEQSSNTLEKIEEFRQKLSNQSNITHQVIQSKDKIQKNNESFHKIIKGPHYQAKQKQFQKHICLKLEGIEQKAGQKIVELEKQMLKLSNKYEIVDEYIAILSRKLEKEKTRYDDVNQAIKRFEQKKIDQKTIETLKNSIKKISKDYEDGLQLKLNKEVYEQEISKLDERVLILSEMVTEKAQKSEVKKWFTFFQEKMKEIIIVLAEEKNATNDGAVKRLPFKCLSCDKELQIQNQEQSINVSNSTNIRLSRDNSRHNSIRNSATQLRKKMRISNCYNSTQS